MRLLINSSDFSDRTCIFPVMSTPSVKIIRNKFHVVISNENNHPLHRSLIFFLFVPQLFLFNLYPFIQRYLQPHQRGKNLCFSYYIFVGEFMHKGRYFFPHDLANCQINLRQLVIFFLRTAVVSFS